jgi:hypothetical protein
MAQLRDDEYVALRATIRQRGTVRVIIFAVVIAAWALLILITLASAPRPLSFLFPLMALAAGFEAIFHLHIGVERVGRYLQVFYEGDSGDKPGTGWESTAMAYGRQFPGAGSDPLFAAIFVLATALNLAPTLFVERRSAAWAIACLAHLALFARISLARRQSGRQRAIDLARFRQIQADRGKATGDESSGSK